MVFEAALLHQIPVPHLRDDAVWDIVVDPTVHFLFPLTVDVVASYDEIVLLVLDPRSHPLLL